MHRRTFFLIGVLLFIGGYGNSGDCYAFSPESVFPDFQQKGFDFAIVTDYGWTFDNNFGNKHDGDKQIEIITFKLTGSLGSVRDGGDSESESARGDYFSATVGLSTTFSLDTNIFDLYLLWGGTLYPFKKIFSLSFDIGLGYSYIIFLNHFPYIVSVKGNFDIPVYKQHHITIGAGIQHRNTIKILDYLNLTDSYYGMYNSYFLELGYRIFIN